MEALETIAKIAEHVSQLSFDYESIQGQELDQATLDNYRERFLLFVRDCCPAAITAYMQKANKDSSLNDVTKIHIMYAATRALDGKDF